ncbi:hypothetical protein K440DRAFT_554180 [Wilcoxina mikolae CBS 423.85]|nr:hypothetical protein K440DRAFT_554180 [Wilcoxina mikolae CBS 423.85]
MPGLNPLQNAQPRQQIPNEAPQYFSPFFEQPAKPPPVSIWQPPNVELPRRSKAPTHRPRSPPQIPTAGTWTRKNSEEEKPVPKGLFQPKQKSLDEMMWLGAVTGFPLPEPAPPKEHRSLRSKLVRKPEQIPSQASFATGPKATEAQRKKEEEAKAREKRLEEWATKKKPNASEKQGNPSGISIPIPQPIESRLRPRKKVYTPLPQPEEAALISNRPNAIHRPHLPNLGDGSYAPEKPFLPQPIETVRRSNRPRQPPKKIKSQEEETVWMGLPQPVETIRRSNRKSPLNKMVSGRSTRTVLKEILPEPIETTRRSNRPAAKKDAVPVPVEVTKRSNRPAPTPVQTGQPPTPTTSFFGPEIQPQPIETVRRSHRPISARPLIPQFVETSMRSSRMRVPYGQMHLELPQPISVSRWTSRSPGLRGDNTSNPTSPGSNQSSRHGDRNRRKVQKFQAPAADHVWHLGEPVDSAPTSPVGSPGDSISLSRCPSLSSSTTSCSTSAAWEIPIKSTKKGGIQGRRESLDEGFSDYALALERKLKGKIVSEDRAKEGGEYPFPVTEGINAEHAASPTREVLELARRSESSETIRPKLRTIETEPFIKAAEKSRETNDRDDYPICKSPTFAMFKRPQLLPTPEPDEDEYDYKRQFHVPRMWKPALRQDPSTASAQSPTPPPSLANDGPPSAPPRMWGHHPSGPSPGYTVASLPPAKRRENTAEEVTPDFIDDVYRYLGLQFENIAAKFDSELAAYTGVSIVVVKRNRRLALTKYCEKWVQENPDMEAGDTRKGGLW